MAYVPKLLRVDKTGSTTKSAKVGVLDDVGGVFRLTEIHSIPMDTSPVWDYILALYTDQQLWDAGVELSNAMREAWMSLYQYDDVLDTLDDDRDDCDTDIANIPSADLAALRTILASTVTRQRRSIVHRIRIIKILVRVIRIMAPGAEEAPAE